MNILPRIGTNVRWCRSPVGLLSKSKMNDILLMPVWLTVCWLVALNIMGIWTISPQTAKIRFGPTRIESLIVRSNLTLIRSTTLLLTRANLPSLLSTLYLLLTSLDLDNHVLFHEFSLLTWCSCIFWVKAFSGNWIIFMFYLTNFHTKSYHIKEKTGREDRKRKNILSR